MPYKNKNIELNKIKLGKRYATLIIFLQCTIAWVVAFLIYKIGVFIF